MKKAIIAIVFISSFIGISNAHADSCPAGQGTAIDVNATTHVVTYSCITLPTPPPPIIMPTPAPSASTPSIPIISAPETSTATTSTATITPPPVVTPTPPIVAAAPSNNDAFIAALNRLLNIIYALMLKLGISVG